MLRKIAGLGLALGLAFTGAAVSPVKAVEEEVRSERISPVLTENAASADAGKKEKEVAPVAPLEGAFSFVPFSGNTEAASADASEEKKEEVAQSAPQALGGESEAAAPAAMNNCVPFKRVRCHSNAPPGAEPVVAGRPAAQNVAHDPRSERLVGRGVDTSSLDKAWKRIHQGADINMSPLNDYWKRRQEEIAPPPTSSEVTPLPKVETEAQPHAPPEGNNQAEIDSAPSNRERVGIEKTSTDVEGGAQNQEEPASPAIEVELDEEVIEIPEEPTSSSVQNESESVQIQAQEEPTKTGSDSVTEGDNLTDEDAQVEASESVVEENVVQTQEESVDEASGGNAGLEDNVSTNESGNAESLESQENLEVQEISNEASESGKADADLEETIPADESNIGADDGLESQENLGVQETPNNEAPGDGNLDADLEETIPADESEIDDEPLESVEEVEEGGPPEISTSLGFTGVGDEEETPTFDVGVGFVQDDFGVETIIKTPVGGGETAVDAEVTLPFSEITSVSLKAEDLLSEGSTITASADIQVLPNLIVSPGIEKSSDEALKTNLSAALQATENLALAFDIENVAAEPVFNIESNLVLGEHEVVARIKDVSKAARTFDLEGSIQVVEWARARVKFESIFSSPVVGLGADLQLTRSTELNVGVNDAFGSQTYDAKIKYTFGL